MAVCLEKLTISMRDNITNIWCEQHFKRELTHNGNINDIKCVEVCSLLVHHRASPEIACDEI